jgi:hypothetical protein
MADGLHAAPETHHPMKKDINPDTGSWPDGRKDDAKEAPPICLF